MPVKDIIIVCKCDVLAMRCIQSRILCLGNAAVALVYYLNSLILGGILITNLGRCISCTIIYKDYLKMRVRLSQNRIDAVWQILLRVIDRNND